ncbi:MAG: RidA family protein [Myxococcales bacterium]|nr:MAG: RidA family protein [Myxococcales bacterium]
MSNALEVATVVPKGYEVQYETWKLAPAVRVGDTLHCSGQLGLGPDGALPADAESQFENAFRHVAAVLAAAGFEMGDLVELTSFHVGLCAEMDTFVRVRDRHLGEPYAAQTAVGVAELGIPGALIELKATAVRGAGSRRA